MIVRSLAILPLLALIALNPADCPGERLDTVLHDNRQREYHLYVPPAHDGVTPLPLVIGLHGFAATPVGFRKDTGIDLVAEREGFYVVYPAALLGSWHMRGYVPGAVDDIGFLETLIDHLASFLPIDQDRVYIAGQSQAGFLAHQAACILSDRIAGIALVGSGAIPDRVAALCAADTPTAIIAFHGTSDLTVPFGGREFSPSDPFAGVPTMPVPDSMAFWAAQNGCGSEPIFTELPDMDPNDNTLVETFEWTNCDPNADVTLYKIINGGHTWPGSIRPIGNGRRSNEFVASEVMWEFFKAHPNGTSRSPF